jgi:tetratricopeptide (TPR) repeat protein
LLAALARFRDWRVYEEDQISRQHVGMAHAVEASAYDDGMALRFVLTLREIATGKFVWSERFSLGSDAWFGTMQTVIRRIAVALEVNISSERLERVAGRPDVSLELFDRWLKGQQSIFRWKPEDEAIAESLFRSIIREAPHFAPAHAGIAGILNVRHLIFPGIYRSEAAQREALAFALRAVELDPLDSRTQLHLGWSFAMNGEFQKAAMTFQLAFELNPDDPWTLVSSAEGLALCGSMRESLTLVQLAQQTGFMFSELQWSYQAAIWFMAGKYEDCITAAANADSALNCSGAFAAAAYGLTGRPDKAKSTATKFVARIQDIWVAREKPTDREVVRWLLLGFPIASEDVRQKLGQGLAIAGLPLPSHALAGARG